MVFSLWTVTYAVEDYTVLAPLPGIGDPATGKTDLQKYLPAAFKLGIGIAAALAFVMITLGGITYATSDAVFQKSQGKEWITNAIWGLLLVIGAWVILNTINPKILRFDLSLPKPEIKAGAPTVTAGINKCPNCETFASKNIPTSGSANGKSIAPYFLDKLVSLNEALNRKGVSWAVTEGYPPSDTEHISTCHQIGTCIDAKLNNPSGKNINAFADSAYSQNFVLKYEVQTPSEKEALVKQGARSPLIDVNPKATGPHFHIR